MTRKGHKVVCAEVPDPLYQKLIELQKARKDNSLSNTIRYLFYRYVSKELKEIGDSN